MHRQEPSGGGAIAAGRGMPAAVADDDADDNRRRQALPMHGMSGRRPAPTTPVRPSRRAQRRCVLGQGGEQPCAIR